MSGGFRRIGEYLGLVEDSGRYDDEYDNEATSVHSAVDERGEVRPAPRQSRPAERAPERAPKVRRPATPAPATPAVSDLAERRLAPVPSTPEVSELSRIITLHPSTYNEARTVGENFRDGIPVIMNLTEMGDSDARRLVDFAAGLVFALHGTIERVTNKVFLLSPQNVQVSAEERERLAEGGFFNQS